MNGYRTQQLGWFDTILVVIFLLGLYLNVSLQITPKIPLTCAPSGFAGLLLLWRRRDRIDPRHLGGLLAVIALYLGATLSATNYDYLGKRFTGLLQLTYSLVICYAFFVTMVQTERRQIAKILLIFCLSIAVGCFLEQYAGLRAISDAVRERMYDSGIVYDADLRDQLLYGRVRPKLFTSEPASVTFTYTHYTFTWLVVSQWRWKLLVYIGLMGVGLLLMPGPTLLLMLMLAVPYLIFLHGQDGRGKGVSITRMVAGMAVSAVLVAIALVVGSSFFAERIAEFSSGKDASFFYRVIGPMLVAFDVFKRYPWAGAGLTGEPFITDQVLTVFMNSSGFQAAWRIDKVSEVLTNYFWLHWIYLGLVWGTVTLIGIGIWLRMIGAPSLLYCFGVWLILGQAGGAYVGPKTWSVILIAAASAALTRQAVARSAGTPAHDMREGLTMVRGTGVLRPRSVQP
ncbi:hypothetical protein [Vineibacter terrae]|uniref:hypothetical protein n=1 Tax=Vineibacter terrae TaxID=2586908 RepID=UPI002E3644FE|nr:hypothetical protein [Vineibacter terrae]HEX2890282.1 hypothetical protein [Vineibacter terrae]